MSESGIITNKRPTALHGARRAREPTVTIAHWRSTHEMLYQPRNHRATQESSQPPTSASQSYAHWRSTTRYEHQKRCCINQETSAQHRSQVNRQLLRTKVTCPQGSPSHYKIRRRSSGPNPNSNPQRRKAGKHIRRGRPHNACAPTIYENASWIFASSAPTNSGTAWKGSSQAPPGTYEDLVRSTKMLPGFSLQAHQPTRAPPGRAAHRHRLEHTRN